MLRPYIEINYFSILFNPMLGKVENIEERIKRKYLRKVENCVKIRIKLVSHVWVRVWVWIVLEVTKYSRKYLRQLQTYWTIKIFEFRHFPCLWKYCQDKQQYINRGKQMHFLLDNEIFLTCLWLSECTSYIDVDSVLNLQQVHGLQFRLQY